MRVIASTVERAATWATEVTGGAFAYNGHGKNPARYIDGIERRTFRGKTGAREAAAYYANGGKKWAELTAKEVPAWVAELVAHLDRLGTPDKVRQAAQEGRDVAEARHGTR